MPSKDRKRRDVSESDSGSDSDYSSDASSGAEDVLVIRVHNLTRNVTQEHVREIFSKFGKIRDLETFDDRMCDFPKGRCTIEYQHSNEAIEAFANMKGAQIDGEEINVSLIKLTSKAPKRRSRSPEKKKTKGRR
eukprot:NODE_11859_length_533_cov_19.534146_g11571_i0.p1 GENE.NODE_11859_length_533_cov_19.534146_g11571_i0~~NODE_11859_length_533_cov_19.534146_g11571_i0.p1  ORF type:complete len:134 (+),score=28.42 NODE_11859_length_533_cov_19.534146_g11571_i0:56-457(+)